MDLSGIIHRRLEVDISKVFLKFPLELLAEM